jgi:hypothetical protein
MRKRPPAAIEAGATKVRSRKTPTSVSRVAEPATPPAAALPATLSRFAAARASGQVRRKNLNVDQGLLDQARELLGVRTETEAVALGLGAVLDLAEFHAAMLAGFDDLMQVGGLGLVEGEELDLSGFTTPPVDATR